MTQAPSVLRMDLTAANDSAVYEVFQNFSLSPGPGYNLDISNGTGTAGGCTRTVRLSLTAR